MEPQNDYQPVNIPSATPPSSSPKPILRKGFLKLFGLVVLPILIVFVAPLLLMLLDTNIETGSVTDWISLVLGLLSWPATLALFFAAYIYLVAPLKRGKASSSHYALRRIVLLSISVIAVAIPVFVVASIFLNPGPGSEFIIFALPVLAIPFIGGLMGILSLMKPSVEIASTNLPTSVAPVKSLSYGSQVVRGIIFAAMTIAVGFVTLIFYDLYQLRHSVSESEKPIPTTLEHALADIQSCGYIDIVQSKKPVPAKGIEFQTNHYIVYDDSKWPILVDAVHKVSGTPLTQRPQENCPEGSITPR